MANEPEKQFRKSERHEVLLKVAYEHVEGLADYTENLSRDGVFIATEQSLEPGTPIQFQLSFPGLVQPISLRGTVIWRRVRESLNDINPPGIGVQLQFDSDLDRKWLHDLLKKAESRAQEAPAPQPGADPEPGEYTIVLAEDNPMTRTLFTEALQTLNMPQRLRLKLIEASGPAQASELIAEHNPELLIVEWRLCLDPQHDLLATGGPDSGRDTIKPTRVVVGASQEESEQALARGADVFLRRPVPARALLSTVQAFVENSPEGTR